MTDKQTVDLIIQTQLKGGRSLQEITQSVEKLEAALREQADAASRGEGSFRKLQQTQEALASVQQELSSQRAVIASTIGKLTREVTRQEQKFAEAKKAVEDFKASLSGDITKAQQKELDGLQRKLTKASEAYDNAQKVFNANNVALRDAGIEFSKLAGEVDQFDAAIKRNFANITAAARQVANFAEVNEQAVAAQRKAAQEAERLARFQRGNEDDARLALQQRADASRRAEQAESDRLVALQRLGAIQQARQTQVVADSELANIRDAEAFLKRYNDEKERAAKRDAGLAQAAQDAEKAAKGYTGLARAAADLTPRTQSLRDALRAIENPAEAARSTLAGVEKEISDLATAIAQNGGRVDDYRSTLAQLGAAQRALSTQGNLIDTFRQQQQAVSAAEIEYKKANAELVKLASALRQGGEGAEKLTRPLAEAQARLKATAQDLGAQRTALNQQSQALKAAGIDSDNLTEAQQRLTTAAQRATKAVGDLSRETKQLGATSGRSGLAVFNDDGRESLSLMQRLRGEVLSLFAAFTGLYGVIDLARTSLAAFSELQAAQSSIAFGLNTEIADPRVGEELQYIRDQADRLGISLSSATKSYGNFVASATKSGATLQEAKFIFESFAATGRVLNLSADDQSGVFRALTQSFALGRVQADEINQLSERLPGAFGAIQEALKKEFPNLKKSLEEGKVGAENLVIIAQKFQEAAEKQLPAAIKSLNAEQERFNNSVLLFKKEIADAGFADAYIGLLKELTAFFKSEDGKAFAQDIGQAFTAIINGARGLLTIAKDLYESLDNVLKLLGALVALAAFRGIIGGAKDAAEAVKGISGAVKGVGGALTVLQNGFVLLRIVAIAFAIGTILWEQRDLISKFASWLVMKISVAFVTIGEVAETWVIDLMTWFRRLPNALIEQLNKIPGVKLDLLTVDESKIDASLKRVRDKANDARARIESNYQRMTASAGDPFSAESARLSRSGTKTTDFPGKRKGTTPPGDDKKAEQAAKRRENEIDALNKQLDSLDARLDRAQTDNLAKQLEAIDTQYRALAKRIAEIGGKEAVQLGERWGTLYAEARNAAIEKFNEARAKAEQSLQAKIESVEAAAGKKQRDDIEARREAVRKANEELFRDLEKERQIRIANGLDTKEIDSLRERLKLAQEAQIKLSDQKTFAEQLAAREKAINDLLEVRKEKIAQIRQLQSEGQITDVVADDQVRQLVADSQPRLEDLINKARAFGETLRGSVSDTTLDAFIAKLDAARNSGARLTAELNNTSRVIQDGMLRALDAGVGAAVDAIGQLATGTMTLGQAFKQVGRDILNVMREVINSLIAAAIRAAILRAFAGGSGSLAGASGFGDYNSSAALAGVRHSGGVVGSVSNRRRAVDPTWFSNAPRYHSGGIVGLRPDEYPAILQRNEEVLSKSDPRNVMNGGGMQAAAQSPQSVRVVLVDDPKRAAEQLAGSDGEKVVMQHIRSNLPTLRQMLR